MSAPLGMIPSAGTFAIRYHQSNAVLANLPTLADLEPQNRSALSGIQSIDLITFSDNFPNQGKLWSHQTFSSHILALFSLEFHLILSA
jgi:hypothetical protein